MKKQLLSILMAVMMLLTLCPGAVALADDSFTLAEAAYVPQTDLPGSEELFSGYLEKQLGGGISMFSTGLRTAGSRLTGDAKAMYDGLKPYMLQIAAGELDSAVISMGKQVGTTVPMIDYAFTCLVDNTVTGPVIDALLLDMPYEMYWFDKTEGIQYSYYKNADGNTELLNMYFYVVDAYQGADDFTLNARPASVATAVANAKKVVADMASASDYMKLQAYSDYICSVVDYNDAAAEPSYTGGFGDPWQMIYVFDGDASTKVVCEGYAKAFQYLCDLTEWRGDVQCYSVSGTMAGGTGEGPHMWNIVTINGQSYLVDVTNSDAGTVGQGGELFMAGEADEISGGYIFTDIGINFIYDGDTTSMWGRDGILKLAGKDYDPSQEPVIYTVTFVDGQGKVLKTQEVESGKAATAPADPTREGYTFTGWDKKFDSITADTTVTAQWKVNAYTITFNTDGGSAIAAITQDYGTKVTAPEAPTKTGYTFAGWDKEIPANMPANNLTVTAKWTVKTYTVTFVDGNGATLSTQTVNYGEAAKAPANPTWAGHTFTGWDKKFDSITADTTVTAQWKVNAYTITFNTDGGSAIAAITQDYGTKVTAPEAPTKTGYTFAGWDKEIPANMPANDLTVTAKWTVKTYTVTFVDGNGTTLSTQTVNYGEAAKAPANPTREGYTFTGWDKKFDSITADTTVTAQWKVNAYTITFNTDGGSAIAAIMQDYGTKVTAPEAPTKAGYTFAGWDKEIPANMPANNLTVTAKWTVKTYTVTFVDGNGATLSTQTVNYGEAAKAPADPTWAGHTFTGWDKAFDKITADLTVTAKWDVTVYTVTFVDGQGNKLSEQKVESGKAATAPADPTREGYTFTGWDKKFDNITADTTVTAQWKIKTYTVTFVDGNGATLSTQTVNYGEAAKAPADPTWAGHTFTGWDKAFDKITADLTVTAKWDVTVYTVTFVDGQGNKLSEQKVESGKAATAPADPTREGYTFTGWDKKFDNVTADATVTAQWKIKTYTVTFVDGNGATLSTQTVNYGEAAKAPANPTWAGHTFTGWDKTFDKITADTTITAKWDVVTYTVTVTNGSGGGKYAEGAAVTISAKAPEAGMKFTGWTGLNGLTITQGSAETVSLTFTMPAADVSVSAGFEKAAEEKFTVSFAGNGGAGSMDAVEMTAGTLTLPVCTLSAPEGKQFKAWRVNGMEYAVGSKISVSADMTVEAVWEDIPVQGSAPVITNPTAAKTVSVYEGEKGEMSITAKDATAYQWYINRQDGKGYVAIRGAESASYTTSVVDVDNDGYTYYCVASNRYGQVQSPVFTLEVLVETEVPETGDTANIALWLALMFISMAGFAVMAFKTRRSN